MNRFVVLSIACVVFTYYGGQNVPKMLKDNKQVLLGFAVALVLCSFFKKDLVEGYRIYQDGECIRRLYGGESSMRRHWDERTCEDAGVGKPPRELNTDETCYDNETDCRARRSQERWKMSHPGHK
jgi:hypothetical protein